MPGWLLWLRTPVGLRTAAAVVLCVLTAALQFSDIRYATARPSLIPSAFAPGWGVSRQGVGLVRENISMALVSRTSGQPPPFMVRDVPNFRGADAVRIDIEVRTNGVVPGPQFWQAARVLLWSYDTAGRRLRYLPYEVVRLDGTGDWHAATLTVPVVDAIQAMRIIIVQAGEAGTMMMRGLSVEALTETDFYRITRIGLIGLWIVGGLWAAVPLLRGWTRARALTTILLIGTLVGALTPQPLMSNTMRAVATIATEVLEPARGAIARLAPGSVAAVASQSVAVVLLDGQPQSPQTASPAAGQPAHANAPSTPAHQAGTLSNFTTTLLADFSPRFDLDEAHLVAFALLAIALPFAFPGLRMWQLFAGLVLLGIAIELVQSFYISRAAEWDDLAKDTVGAALGLALTAGFLFLRRSAKKPA